ncbi:MAG: GFA family protein [Caulobacteraceae bacterium]
MSDITGGCLCGAVRFCYAGPLGGAVGAVTVCHCAKCRKAQGYAAAVAPALAAGFQVTSGAGEIREFQSSPGKFRAFCAACGSPLYSRLEAAPERLRLRLGALDDPPATLTIDAHTFTEGVPAWSVSGDAAPRYAGREPGRP